MEFGPVIDALLKKQGRTRRELAKACGVTTSTVSYWISNTVSPSYANQALIANFFSTTVADITAAAMPKTTKKAKTSKAKRAVA
jgi:transcriptional regulator with XRE-family HTH domain